MKDDFTHSIQDIPDRKPLEQFAATSFGLLTLLQSLPKNLQFDDTECPLDAKDQLVVQIIQVIDLLLVGEQRSKNLAYFK